MCGIFAIYNSSSRDCHDRADQALALIAPRGPDSQRTLFSPNRCYSGVLGAARLAMVDINGAHQPLSSSDQRYRIAVDGEIWNYRRLRRDLEATGVGLQTAGDIEVLLYMVARYGDQAPQHLDGQFAYIVEDTHAGMIYAGRDPHGISPLFFGTNAGGDFVLASSVRVLLANAVTGEDIRILPQGHTLRYQIATGRLWCRCYCALDSDQPTAPLPAITELRSRVVRLIASKIPEEVPYATIVGGLDSSLVTAVCCANSFRPRCIVSVATSEDQHSRDVANARLLADSYGIDCRIAVVDADYIASRLELVIEVLASANYLEVVTGIVGLKAAETAKAAGVRAIITGGGADEIFAGYDFAWSMYDQRHLEANLRHIYRQSGNFECHREDSVTAAVGLEARPAYYDSELARMIFAIPLAQRIIGLGSSRVIEKAILKKIATGIVPESIVNTRKSPFYRSTSIVKLFEKVAARMFGREQAIAWKRHLASHNPAWLRAFCFPGCGPVFVHCLFCKKFPTLANLLPPTTPPDYNDPQSYGQFHAALGSPILEGPAQRLSGIL